jgi:hypothetical protein
MLFEESGIIISGITEQGNKFRPSDWVERIASDFANFEKRKLHFSQLNPQGFQFVMNFAMRNHLKVEQVEKTVFSEVA